MTGYRKELSTANGTIERLTEPRRSNRRKVHENKTKKWAERSVWTMVCAIELGLIEPATTIDYSQKLINRGRKPVSAKKRATCKGPPQKSMKPLSNAQIKNRKIIQENFHRDIISPEHRYSLPPSSSFLENQNSDKNNGKTSWQSETTIYNPYNKFENASGKIDIYEYNRRIKNQTGPRSQMNFSIEESSDEFENQKNSGKSLKIGKLAESETPVRKLRKNNRRKKKNPYSNQSNKHKRSSKKDNDKFTKNDFLFSYPRIIEETSTDSSKSSKDDSSPLNAKKIEEKSTNKEIYDEELEIDDSLMVNPSTDLPLTLLSSNDHNDCTVDLSPTLNTNLDLTFDPDSFVSCMDSLTRESISQNESDESSNEFDESYERSYCTNFETYEETVSQSNAESPESVKSDDNSFSKNSIKKSMTKSVKENRNSVNRHKRRSADASLTRSMEDKENNNNVVRVTRGSMRNSVLTENNNETIYTIGTVVWGNCTGWWPGLIVDAEDVGMCSTEGKSWVYWIGENSISELRNKTQIQTFSTGLRSRMIDALKTKTNKDENYVACLATLKLLNEEILEKDRITQPYHIWVERNLMILEDIDQIILYPYPSEIQNRLDELKKENFEITRNYLLELEKPTTAKINIAPKSSTKSSIPSEHGNLPLMKQKPGVITWAKIMGQKWWPAMIIDYRDCGMKEPTFGCQWILWYGDYTLSQVNHRFFLAFDRGIFRMKDYVINCKKEVYKRGVLEAAKDYCAKYGYKTDDWSVTEVFDWFSKFDRVEETDSENGCLPGIPGCLEQSQKYPKRIVEGLKKHKGNCTVAAIREHNIKDSDYLKAVKSGKENLDSLCLMCLEKIDAEDTKMDHPFFIGKLCEECSEKYKPTIFAYGDDGKCFFCTVCAGSDTVVLCDESDCPRVYCTSCLKYLIAPRAYDDIMLNDPWLCFLCQDSSDSLSGGLLIPRNDWKDRVAGLFHANNDSFPNRFEHYKNGKKKIRVLSLFDGISAGLVVLQKLGIEIEAYYASEIDPDAEMVSSAHFGNEIIRLGDVRNIDEKKIREICPIDLLIGGSPCNDLSLVNPMRLGLHDPNGTGVLVFEYCRVKDLIRDINGEQHFFWLFENVASMPSKYRLEINKILGREPDLIDSANYSPQHRPRLYWSNLPSVSYPTSSQDLQDVLTPNCNRHALVKKIRTVTTRVNSLKQGKNSLRPILMNQENDSVWITELEEIFGFPRHYTDVKNLCATKRQKLIGMSWSVQTITEIMRPLCNFFKVRSGENP